MRRLQPLSPLPTLRITTALLAALLPGAVYAQVDAGAVCAPLEQSLREAQKARNEAEASRSRSEAARASCSAELGRTQDRLQAATQAESSCQNEKQLVCSQAGAFAERLADGQPPTASPNACISAEQVSRIGEHYRALNATQSALTQLGAYAAGEIDALPAMGGGGTQAERILSRVLSTRGGPRVYRRLLVESLQRLVPNGWAKLKAQGPVALENWFNSAEPLDPELVAEAKSERSADRSEPVLSTSLRLVQAYELLTRCNDPAQAPKTCPRARQLRQLLESTGPLTVARRSEEIWATECSAISPQTVAAWLVDFPTEANSPVAGELLDVVYFKSYTCWLTEGSSNDPFAHWLASRLPAAGDLPQRSLLRRKELEDRWREGSPQDVCGRAVVAMNEMPGPDQCAMPQPTADALRAWASTRENLDEASRNRFDVRVCDRYATELWNGKSVTIPAAFERAPALEEIVRETEHRLPTAIASLRTNCQRRQGKGEPFEASVVQLGRMAESFGDDPTASPWRLASNHDEPQEEERFREADRATYWLNATITGRNTCEALGLEDDPCNECRNAPAGGGYDCEQLARLDRRWSRYRIISIASALGLAVLVAGVIHGLRLLRARRRNAVFATQVRSHLDSLGLPATQTRLRWLVPDRWGTLRLQLPKSGGWERHGSHALVVRAEGATAVSESDVNRAAGLAVGAQAKLAILVHDAGKSPDLGAIRASLDWSARGGHRAVQVLPISTERLNWSSRAVDLLDVVDDSSMRGNPFEVRGRITSSAQFFNRERLVSGLLAAAQGGKWMIVTGLRRFGKSSLTLEVARRLPGPSAYVDLTGFYHELSEGTGETPALVEGANLGSSTASAVDMVLRQLCQNLVESARNRYVGLQAPQILEGQRLDSPQLSGFFRELSRAIEGATGQSAPPMLIVLDEVEQALGQRSARDQSSTGLAHSVEAFAVLLGRLKSAVVDASAGERQAPVSVFLGCAVHPILWAPLPTLAQQSIMGTFQSVCVPALPVDAAEQMMQSLGAWHGVRFAEPALARLIEASQRIPLLLRRLGSSVLELYDVERANQGGLGAVNVGEVGADEAIAREERKGSAVRVWVESEIAPAGTPVGAVLRHLAETGDASLDVLAGVARGEIMESFREAGFADRLSANELDRRADEAAHVTLRLLGESGLVEPLGDLTSPDGYRLPDSIVRRTLRRGNKDLT